MGKVNPIQTNFSAGEISPLLYGRTDIQKYANGAATLTNFITKPQGGVSVRPGTVFCAPVIDSTRLSRLIPFVFSEQVAYVVELGHLMLRVYYNGLLIPSGPGGPILEIVTPYLETDLADIKFAQSGDTLYLCHPAYPVRKFVRTSSGTPPAFSLLTVNFFDGPYLVENETPTLLTLGTTTDRATLTVAGASFVVGDVGKFVQYTKDGAYRLAIIRGFTSSTILTIEPLDNVIPDVDLSTKLTYGAPNIASTLAIFTSANVGAYIRIRETNNWHLISAFTNSTSIVVGTPVTQVVVTGLQPIESNRTITSTLSATSAAFISSDVGRSIRLDLDTQQLSGKISAYSSATSVTVAWDRDVPINESDYTKFAAFGQTTKWRLGAWSASTGYPSAIAFHEQRLVFAASPTEPQTVWMSVSGDYESFSPTQNDSKVFDDNAITITIASGKIDAIKWLDSGPTLVVGTLGSCWQIRASSLNEAITPTNINAQAQNASGASKVQPVRVGTSLLFVQRLSGKLREMFYEYQSDSLVDKEVSIISEHLLRENGGIREIAFQEYRNSSLWVCLNNGKLACMTFVKEQEVYSWHKHEIAGTFGSNNYGKVESICCIPSPSSEDLVYLVVARTIAGVTQRYVEYLSMELNYGPNTSLQQMVLTDCSKILNTGSPTTAIGALGYLEGQTVSVLVDGATVVSRVPSTGIINFSPVSGTNFVVGLPYTSTLKTLTPEGGGMFGTAQGKNKRINKCVVRLMSSAGFKYGADIANLYESPLGTGLQLVSKDLELTIQDENRLTPQIVIVRDKPFPLNILAIMPEIQVNA